jgi:hypothetical protein
MGGGPLEELLRACETQSLTGSQFVGVPIQQEPAGLQPVAPTGHHCHTVALQSRHAAAWHSAALEAAVEPSP